MPRQSLWILTSFALCLIACESGPGVPAATPTTDPGAPAPGTSTPAPAANYQIGDCGAYRETDNLVSNGSLEAPIVRQERQTFTTGSKFTNWSVDSGTVALLGVGPAMAHGAQSAALSGSLSQVLSPLPNKTNLLTFCYAAEPGASTVTPLSISWSGQVIANLPAQSPAGSTPVWKGVSISLPPASSNLTPLIFSAQGTLIDAVRVSLQ